MAYNFLLILYTHHKVNVDSWKPSYSMDFPYSIFLYFIIFVGILIGKKAIHVKKFGIRIKEAATQR